MSDLNEMVLAAKTDDLALGDLVARSKQWILKSAYQAVHRYITDSDDEWSVALIAFSEAVRNYDPEKGSFYALASLVIRRRLYDYQAEEKKHSQSTCVAPEVFSGDTKDVEGDRAAFRLQGQVLKAEREEALDDTAAKAREEIEEMQEILGKYGFSFFDLAEASPKAAKTKKNCARAICTLIASAILMMAMRLKRKLPAKDLSAQSGITIKILDRYRRYIIASAEILDGPFPILASYLEYIPREGRAV